jgi:ketol-acid reductoisomerase
MTRIFYEQDADRAALEGLSVAVVGYGNQGRSWALNLRDSGVEVRVCARADESREQATADGFAAADVDAASRADVICALVPDDVIPTLPFSPRADALVVVASGYCLAFNRYTPDCDLALVAPRMLGPEVRRCYEEGTGFITGFGVHRDSTGNAERRALAIAHGIGGLKQGAIEMTAMQETIVDLGVEQALSPALRHVSQTFVQVMLEYGVPLEAILTELFLSGEVERTYRLLRLEGYAAQFGHHSPVSQYGQLSRANHYTHIDLLSTMQRIVDGIASGAFADEWDAERDAGHPTLARMREESAGALVAEFEQDLRRRLGERVGGS